MINNTELQRVVFKTTITSTGTVVTEPVYVSVRLDLTLVIAYGNYVDSTTGSTPTNITEVFVQGVLLPMYIRMSYSAFHDLIQAL